MLRKNENFVSPGSRAESIEWFIEDQAFSRSYDLAPPPPGED